ncbi:methyltransferase-like protein 25B isoform X1 [Athalia rosae]|uniref:methyltransferase-like protein 25B isoform X1 n=2 Tax=Athalia rosae TaxID=37344 RepID=UPI0020339277|nr:methyltransferase-like protein 25B isoform X1 [Athalia rosae]
MDCSQKRNTCSCQTCERVREKIRRIFCVLDIYGWLLDAYIVDFYKDDLWDRLPNSWKKFFENTTPEELGSWILNEHPRSSRKTRVWPLSLQALRHVIRLLEIDRDQQSTVSLECENANYKMKGSLNRSCSSGTTICSGETNMDLLIDNSKSHQKLQKMFVKHMKPKKTHEIDIMATIVAECAASAHSECVLDVGAGMGHLARMLAYRHDMCVTCVEQQPVLSERARNLDLRYESMVLKHLSISQGQKPHHISLKIERDSGSRLLDELNQVFKDNFQLNPKLSGFGLIGLHPCGDLAATLLHSYTESDCAKFICIAACCYMKLTIGEKPGVLQGYPLSKFLGTLKVNIFSYAALEVSCHAVENHCHKLKSAECWELKVHAYRAVLESLLVKKNPTLRHGKLKSVKLKQDMTFRDYCVAATKNLPQEYCPDNMTETSSSEVTAYLDHWERVVIFTSIRMMLAPLVESVVLLDRFLYLSEKMLSPKLKAVFDPAISPRNFILTSVKIEV